MSRSSPTTTVSYLDSLQRITPDRLADLVAAPSRRKAPKGEASGAQSDVSPMSDPSHGASHMLAR